MGRDERELERLFKQAQHDRVAWAEGHETLYKFKGLTGDSRAHVFDIIQNSRIYMSTPDEFDDPLDCNPVCKTAKDLSDADFVRELQIDEERMIAGMHLTADEVAAMRRDFSIDIHSMAEAVTESMRKELRADSRLFCLSATQNNPLLWAHYAGGHTGVCLHFHCPRGTDAVFSLARRVDYAVDRLPVLIPLKYNESDDVIVDRMVLTKSIDWQYEAEYRIVGNASADWGHTVDDRYCAFAPRLLTGITLGMKISAADRDVIIALAATLCGASTSPG